MGRHVCCCGQTNVRVRLMPVPLNEIHLLQQAKLHGNLVITEGRKRQLVERRCNQKHHRIRSAACSTRNVDKMGPHKKSIGTHEFKAERPRTNELSSDKPLKEIKHPIRQTTEKKEKERKRNKKRHKKNEKKQRKERTEKTEETDRAGG